MREIERNLLLDAPIRQLHSCGPSQTVMLAMFGKNWALLVVSISLRPDVKSKTIRAIR